MSDAIHDYILNQPETIQPVLEKVYDTIHGAIPGAQEIISWQMPTWRRRINLIHFAAMKKHLGLYPGPKAVEHFRAVLEERGYSYSKGTIRFPYDNVQLDLIGEIAAWAAENQND